METMLRTRSVDEFELLYTPISSAATGEIEGMESFCAELRVLGAVSPARFIPCRGIRLYSRWAIVIAKACGQIRGCANAACARFRWHQHLRLQFRQLDSRTADSDGRTYGARPSMIHSGDN
jgi:EAL domain-containing protein (putative c-di-GMP-specific phosphodiesterase class I)